MSSPTNEELLWLWRTARAPRLRTLREFAEQEIIIPDGEAKGWRFTVERQPYTGALLDEIDSGRWLDILISGPSQSGKTLTGFVLPAIYHTVELVENYVVGIPDMRMANNKWKVDFEPVFRASPALERLLPTSGPGSRGGDVKDTITLTNGAVLKFMTAGGDDVGKAGFTARCVGVTEAARFSQVGGTSVEADPLRQLRARQRSFDRDRRRLYVEGTVTIAEELPWTLREQSTKSRLLVPCPHCQAWILPGRGDLLGWQDARSEIEAAENVRFFCPECGEAIAEQERRAAVRECKLVHDGQTIDRAGQVTGEPPATTRLWFQWHAFHNLFVSTADFGAEEWLAAQAPEETAEREHAERALCQFVHSLPYVPPQLDDTPLKSEDVRRRIEDFPKGQVPADTTHLTCFVDCGKWTSWFMLIAFRANRTLHVVDYGALDVPSDQYAVERALLQCLREFRDTATLGWPVQWRGINRTPDAVWIDRGHWKKVVYAFVRETKDGRYLPSLGRGSSHFSKLKYIHPTRTTNEVRQLGDQWHVRRDQAERQQYVTLDVDHYKRFLQERLAVKLGEPGSLSLYKSASANEHVKLSKHFTSEAFRRELVPGRGVREFWHQSGANHLLDCAAGCCAAANRAGWRLLESEGPPPVEPPTDGWFAAQKRSRRDEP